MSRLQFGWAALLVAAAVAVTGSQAPPAGSPLTRREHPRIWITRASIPELQKKLSGRVKSDYQAFVSSLDDRFSGSRGSSGRGRRDGTKGGKGAKAGREARAGREANEDRAGKADDPDSNPDILNYAFVYRVGQVPGIRHGHTIAEYGAHAKALLLGEMAKTRTSKASYWPDVAYDWLYDVLTPDERRQVWSYLEALDQKQSSLKDPWDDRASRTVRRRVLAGLAFSGDGLNDQKAGELENFYHSHVTNGGTLDAANLIAADDGGVSEGWAYAGRGAGSSSIENLLKTMEAWRTANGLSRQEVFGGTSATALRYFPQWAAYMIRPFAEADPELPGGHRYLAYKTHVMDTGRPIGTRGPLRALLSELRLYKDLDPQLASLTEWLLRERVGQVDVRAADEEDGVLLGLFLFGEGGIEPRSPSQLGLPLTKIFDGIGWVVMRTGWDKLTDSMVTFIASPWRRSAYTNSNQNSFTIDRHGPLALNSGVRTHHGYSNATWAHNTIIFPDPSDARGGGEGTDLGGQRRSFKPVVTSASMLKPGSIYDLGGIKRFQPADAAAGLDFDYVLGDATRAYNGPLNADEKNTQKVKLFTRQLVYFRPAQRGGPDQVVVFDRAETTDVKFEKRWLLHTAGNPRIDGKEELEREGKWTYSGASLVTATNTVAGSAGRLFSRTLLPLERRIVKIGGPGHEFENPYGSNDPSKGFDPNDESLAQYVGTFRVEVIPVVPSTFDLFLHVLEATDANVEAATPSVLLEGTGMVGARVGQRIAAFSRAETPVVEAALVIDRQGVYQVLLCDLVPGAEYEIGHGGGSSRIQASKAGVAYLPLTTTSPNARLSVKATGAR